MISVTKTITTETAHRLIDYVGKCASIHGHSYLWEVTAQLEDGGVGANGIAIDFGDLKEAMRAKIYDEFDHALVLADADPLMKQVRAQDAPTGLRYAASGGKQKIFAFPGNPTAEHFASWAADKLQTYCDWKHPDAVGSFAQIVITRVRVWETANSYAEWNKRS